MDVKRIVETLNSDEVRSEVLKDAAFFDFELGMALNGFFCNKEGRRLAFYELILDRLNFDEKLRALEKLPLRRRYRSVAAFPVLRQLQQVRNLIAHEWHISENHEKLANAQWLYLFADYPKSYRKAVKLTRLRLDRLISSGEFYDIVSRRRRQAKVSSE